MCPLTYTQSVDYIGMQRMVQTYDLACGNVLGYLIDLDQPDQLKGFKSAFTWQAHDPYTPYSGHMSPARLEHNGYIN